MNSLKYYERMKRRPSAVDFNGPTDRHHLSAVGMGNNREKEMIEHYSVINLTRQQHQVLHARGVEAFEQRYKINLWECAFKNVRDYAIDLESEIEELKIKLLIAEGAR